MTRTRFTKKEKYSHDLSRRIRSEGRKPLIQMQDMGYSELIKYINKLFLNFS